MYVAWRKGRLVEGLGEDTIDRMNLNVEEILDKDGNVKAISWLRRVGR